MPGYQLTVSAKPLTNGFGFGLANADVAASLDDLSSRLKTPEVGLVVDSMELTQKANQTGFVMKTLTLVFAEKNI